MHHTLKRALCKNTGNKYIVHRHNKIHRGNKTKGKIHRNNKIRRGKKIHGGNKIHRDNKILEWCFGHVCLSDLSTEA